MADKVAYGNALQWHRATLFSCKIKTTNMKLEESALQKAKSQSSPTGTKIRSTGKSEFEVVETSSGDEKPGFKKNDPFLWLRKFPRLAKRGRGRGPHKWFSR